MAVSKERALTKRGKECVYGCDLEFTRAISDAVDILFIASDGAGILEHFYEGVVKGGARVLLAASVFCYRTLRSREVKE